MKSNKGEILTSILTGIAIGAGIGILYAPYKGSKTRKKIRNIAVDSTHNVTDWLKSAKVDLTNTVCKKKDVFDKKLQAEFSDMNYKPEDIINNLEPKLENIKIKNAQLQN